MAALLLFVSSFAGCARETSNSEISAGRSVTDDLGRRIDLPQHVTRAISLAPSITESIFAAGAGDRLVGVTTFCNYPVETASIDKVGDTQSPNIERIVGLKPQVVLISTASQLEAFTDVLAEQNIAVYVSNADNFDDVVRSIRSLGELFGTNTLANEKADDLEHRANLVAARIDNLERARVFVQISRSPLFTIGRTSYLTDIVYRSGGVSVTNDVEKAYPEFSKETALALNPDAIILSDSDDNREPNDVFKTSSAVKNGRVYKINADIISRPGPRLVDAIEQIAGLLHGEKN